MFAYSVNPLFPVEYARKVASAVCPNINAKNLTVSIGNCSGKHGANWSGHAAPVENRIVIRVAPIDRLADSFPIRNQKIKGKGYLSSKEAHFSVNTPDETLVYLLAHEMRHLWQYAHPKGWRVHGSKGKYSERDADAYAVSMLRKFRRDELSVKPGDLAGKREENMLKNAKSAAEFLQQLKQVVADPTSVLGKKVLAAVGAGMPGTAPVGGPGSSRRLVAVAKAEAIIKPVSTKKAGERCQDKRWQGHETEWYDEQEKKWAAYQGETLAHSRALAREVHNNGRKFVVRIGPKPDSPVHSRHERKWQAMAMRQHRNFTLWYGRKPVKGEAK